MKDGIVRVVGTDESEKIEVREATSLTTGQVEGTDEVEVDNTIRVLVNDVEIASCPGYDVVRVNVFGLGGRDTIIGPSGYTGRISQIINAGDESASPIRLLPGPTVRFYVEGGSGNARAARRCGSASANRRCPTSAMP